MVRTQKTNHKIPPGPPEEWSMHDLAAFCSSRGLKVQYLAPRDVLVKKVRSYCRTKKILLPETPEQPPTFGRRPQRVSTLFNHSENDKEISSEGKRDEGSRADSLCNGEPYQEPRGDSDPALDKVQVTKKKKENIILQLKEKEKNIKDKASDNVDFLPVSRIPSGNN